MGTAVTVISFQMRRIVQAFRQAGAVNPGRAIVPFEHGIRQSVAFRRLVQRGIVVAVNPGRYYLNEEAGARYRKQRQAIVLIVVVLLFVFLIITWLVSR